MLKDVVERLWELQQVMTRLQHVQNQLENKPESFAAIDEQFVAASGAIGELEQKQVDLSRRRREAEGRLQDEQETLKKYQGQLMQVKNQLQYTAALKEIDETRKRIAEIEESLLGVMTELEETESDLTGRREALAPLESRHQEEYVAWQGSLGGLREDLEGIQEKAQVIEEKLPRSLRSEFHQIFKRRQGLAVVPVERGSCSVCRVRVRPQTDQMLKRGELSRCEGCSRILYLQKAVP